MLCGTPCYILQLERLYCCLLIEFFWFRYSDLSRDGRFPLHSLDFEKIIWFSCQLFGVNRPYNWFFLCFLKKIKYQVSIVLAFEEGRTPSYKPFEFSSVLRA